MTAYKNNKKKPCRRGYTLIEMCFFIVVLSVVVTCCLMIFNKKVQYDRIASTEKTQNLINAALNDYLSHNGRLPCPATLDARPDTSSFGVSVSDDCLNGPFLPGTTIHTVGTAGDGVRTGAVPVRELNLPDSALIDGWGNRIFYSVTEKFARVGAPVGNASGDISLLDSKSNQASQQKLIYIVMAPGQAGAGAYSYNGVKKSACPASGLESRNCSGGGANATFTNTLMKGTGSNPFTDSVKYLASNSVYHWQTSAWGSCSGICTAGTQTRTISCVDQYGQPAPNTTLCGAPPATSQACTGSSCAWKTGAWNQCGTSCNASNTTRYVACYDTSSGQQQADTLCPQPKPATTKSCAQACCVGGVTYQNGDTWTTKTPGPTASKACPSPKIGTLTCPSTVTTNYQCNNGQAVVVSQTTNQGQCTGTCKNPLPNCVCQDSGLTGLEVCPVGTPSQNVHYYQYNSPRNCGKVGSSSYPCFANRNPSGTCVANGNNGASTIIGAGTYTASGKGSKLIVPSRNWKTGWPNTTGMNSWFGVCMDGGFTAPRTGYYSFVTSADDGIVVEVNGTVVNDNQDKLGRPSCMSPSNTCSYTTTGYNSVTWGPGIHLTGGRVYHVRVRYWQGWGTSMSAEVRYAFSTTNSFKRPGSASCQSATNAQPAVTLSTLPRGTGAGSYCPLPPPQPAQCQ